MRGAVRWKGALGYREVRHGFEGATLTRDTDYQPCTDTLHLPVLQITMSNFSTLSNELLITAETNTYVRTFLRLQIYRILILISAVVWIRKHPYFTDLRALLKDHPALVKWEEAPTDHFDIDRIRPGVVHMDVDEGMLGKSLRFI